MIVIDFFARAFDVPPRYLWFLARGVLLPSMVGYWAAELVVWFFAKGG